MALELAFSLKSLWPNYYQSGGTSRSPPHGNAARANFFDAPPPDQSLDHREMARR
jgi:hypothetical protein